MSGTSKTTTVVGIRLPNEVVELIRQRCEERGYENVADYLRPRIIADITRKHRRNDASERGSERYYAPSRQGLSLSVAAKTFDNPTPQD